MTPADKDLVKLCLKELYEKMGYAPGSKLSQSDLEHLCYRIEEKSRIVLSLSTVKRIFQEKFERLPQASTLDALTLFLGYSGWQDFKAKKSTVAANSTGRAAESIRQPADKKFWRAIRYPVILSCVGIFLFIVFRNSIHTNNDASADFSVKKVVADNVPKNVIFHYNIDDVEGDSFFIQPTWNEGIRIRIRKKNYTQTDTYYEPGYHTAKLLCDGRVLKEVIVHIPTRHWVGYSKVNFRDPYPEYFRGEYIIRDSVLGIDAEGLEASNIDTGKEKIYYYAHFPDSIRINSDNFTLKARVRMKKLGNMNCPWVISEVFTENALFYFTGTIPGCTSEIQAMFSDQYLDGKTNDLSSFGYDVTAWNDIRIDVRHRKVTIYIEKEKVFENTYTRPGGAVQGMGFGSNGLCEVDYVELTDSTGAVSYFNDFNTPVFSASR